MARKPKKVFKRVRCKISEAGRALAEDLMVELEQIVSSKNPYIGPDYRANLEQMADRLVLQADRVDMTAASLGLTPEEAENCGAAQQLKRLIQTVTGTWYGGRPQQPEL
jgi:hypothetical protein